MKLFPINILLLVVLILSGCSDPSDSPFSADLHPDIGPKAKEFWRPSEGFTEQLPLDKAGFIATAGPFYFKGENDSEWDYYSIEVVKKHDNGFFVYFGRYLKRSEVSVDLAKFKIEDLVMYDAENRNVTFDLREKQYSYTLPNR